MENAGKFYEKVEQFPGSSVFGFALYKKAWVEINLGNFKSALEIFVKVIQLCQNGKIPKNQAGPLEKEAKKDLVKAYARTPGASPDKAWDFFQRMGGDYAPKMLESLAELYWEQGMFPESSKIYRKIMSLNENSPRLCEWQNKILRNTLSAGNKKDQVQELKRLGNVYEAMVKKENVKKDVMSECKNSFHDTGKELALIWHKEAQRTKNADTYQLAGMVYRSEGKRQEGRHQRVQELLPRHRQGACPHLAQGSAAHQERRHLPAGWYGLQGVPEPLQQGEGHRGNHLLLR